MNEIILSLPVPSMYPTEQIRTIQYLLKYDFPHVVVNRYKKYLREKSNTHRLEEYISKLREYFLAVLLKKFDSDLEGMILMYNKDVDELWHILILDTKSYFMFCENVFGGYLHHNLTEYCSNEQMFISEQKTQKYTLIASEICSSYNQLQ